MAAPPVAPALSLVQRLHLCRCGLTDAGAANLGRAIVARALPALNELDLSDNLLGADAPRAPATERDLASDPAAAAAASTAAAAVSISPSTASARQTPPPPQPRPPW